MSPLKEPMRGGWVPFPVQDWETVAELLTASGKPWPRSAVIYDMRWRVDQQRVIDGRPTLMKRWNWKEDWVKEVLRRPSIWWDTEKLGPAPEDGADLSLYCPVSKRKPQVATRTPPAPEPENLHNQDDSTRTPPVVSHRAIPDHNPQPQVERGPAQGAQSSAPDRGGLVDDPTAVRRALHDRHAERIASLLEHCQATLPDHAFSPADIKALRPAFDRWSDAQLATVWDWAQLSPEMELARRQGWSTSWASVANDRLPDRVRDARRWHERGRPIEAVTAKITGRRARASPTMNEALGFAPSAPSLFVKTELELALERAAAEDEALGNQRGFDYEPTPFEPMTSGYTGNGGRR